ncbi:hypothetical protein PG985_004672 [Apiospora marii]|uniref:Uncharacterized protein n=1 Tax=Apiospora marii TaxID=335849 RepID=A0ABR1SA16_9PEZI
MHAIFAFIFFLLGLGANAVTFNDVTKSIPDGGYMVDMHTFQNGVLNVTDLDGNMVKGSPFVIDPIPAPGVAIHDSNPDSIRTRDQWGCTGNDVLDEGFWSDAGNKMGRWCDAGKKMQGHSIRWWQTDEDLAYMCNYAGSQNCSWDEYFNYMKFIADKCGYLAPGWFLQGSGNKSYGRGVKGGQSDPMTVCYNMS